MNKFASSLFFTIFLAITGGLIPNLGAISQDELQALILDESNVETKIANLASLLDDNWESPLNNSSTGVLTQIFRIIDLKMEECRANLNQSRELAKTGKMHRDFLIETLNAIDPQKIKDKNSDPHLVSILGRGVMYQDNKLVAAVMRYMAQLPDEAQERYRVNCENEDILGKFIATRNIDFVKSFLVDSSFGVLMMRECQQEKINSLLQSAVSTCFYQGAEFLFAHNANPKGLSLWEKLLLSPCRENVDEMSKVLIKNNAACSFIALKNACSQPHYTFVVKRIIEDWNISPEKRILFQADGNHRKNSLLRSTLLGGSVRTLAILLKTPWLKPALIDEEVDMESKVFTIDHYLCWRMILDVYGYAPLIKNPKEENDLFLYAKLLYHSGANGNFCQKVFNANNSEEIKNILEHDPMITFGKLNYKTLPLMCQAIIRNSCKALQLLLENKEIPVDEELVSWATGKTIRQTALSLAILQLTDAAQTITGLPRDLFPIQAFINHKICIGSVKMIYDLFAAGASLDHSTVQEVLAHDCRPEIKNLVADIKLFVDCGGQAFMQGSYSSLSSALNNVPFEQREAEDALARGDLDSLSRSLAQKPNLDNISTISVPEFSRVHIMGVRMFFDTYGFLPLLQPTQNIGAINPDFEAYLDICENVAQDSFAKPAAEAPRVGKIFSALDEDSGIQKLEQILFRNVPHLYGAVYKKSCLALKMLLQDKKTRNNIDIAAQIKIANTAKPNPTPLANAISELKKDALAQECLSNYNACIGPAKMIYLLLEAGASLEHASVTLLLSPTSETDDPNAELRNLVLKIKGMVDQYHTASNIEAKIEAPEPVQTKAKKAKKKTSTPKTTNFSKSLNFPTEQALNPQIDSQQKQEVLDNDTKLTPSPELLPKQMGQNQAFSPFDTEINSSNTASNNSKEECHYPNILAAEKLPLDGQTTLATELSLTPMSLEASSPNHYKTTTVNTLKKTDKKAPSPEELTKSTTQQKENAFELFEQEENLNVSMPLTPRRQSRVNMHNIQADSTLKGGRVYFEPGILPILDSVCLSDRNEEGNPIASSLMKGTITKSSFGAVENRVYDKMAHNIRTMNWGNLEVDQSDTPGNIIGHGLTTELFVNVLKRGSVYLELNLSKDPSHPELQLLIVAQANRELTNRLQGRAAEGPGFITAAFPIDGEGKIGKCMHFCFQANHPASVEFEPGKRSYLLAPCNIVASLDFQTGRLDLKFKENRRPTENYLLNVYNSMNNVDEESFYAGYLKGMPQSMSKPKEGYSKG